MNRLFPSICVALLIALLIGVTNKEDDHPRANDNWSRIKVFILAFVVCYGVLWFVTSDSDHQTGGASAKFVDDIVVNVDKVEEVMKNIIGGDPDF